MSYQQSRSPGRGSSISTFIRFQLGRTRVPSVRFSPLDRQRVGAADIPGPATGRGEQLADGLLHSGSRCGSVARGSTMEICMSVSAWLAFASASAILVAIPGPTVLLVVSY